MLRFSPYDLRKSFLSCSCSCFAANFSSICFVTIDDAQTLRAGASFASNVNSFTFRSGFCKHMSRISEMYQSCLKGVPSSKDVPRAFYGCSKGVSKLFKRRFEGVSKYFQGSFKGDSRVFHGCFMGVLV